MMEQPKEFVQQTSSLLYGAWEWLCQFLQATGLLPNPPKTMDSLESAMEHTFKPVEPSESFRASLRDNLQIAVQHRADGMVVEYPYILRYRAVLGVSAGILAAAVATLIFIFKPRSRGMRR
jgi:hypothetical protein